MDVIVISQQKKHDDNNDNDNDNNNNNNERMEGWLYLIRSNRIGLQYSRKRYFVLQHHLLQSFKSVPLSKNQDPVRSAIIDSCIRVTDNGRESIHRKVFFIFTVYNTSNHNDQLKEQAVLKKQQDGSILFRRQL